MTIMMSRPRRDLAIIPENIPIKIIYEDDDLLVVDKPAGLVVHPGHGNYTGTLVNALAWYLKDDPTYDPNDPALGLVHRIDKDTSGLLVVAKKPEAKAHLSMQFFNKTTKREYRALVWGIVKDDEGRIEGIVTDGDIRRAMESRQAEFFNIRAMDIATRNPKCISPEAKLIEAEKKMTQHKVNSLLVAEEGKLLGVIQIYDIKL